jgi:hypothetical protein
VRTVIGAQLEKCAIGVVTHLFGGQIGARLPSNLVAAFIAERPATLRALSLRRLDEIGESRLGHRSAACRLP